jgi:hypothetical protein
MRHSSRAAAIFSWNRAYWTQSGVYWRLKSDYCNLENILIYFTIFRGCGFVLFEIRLNQTITQIFGIWRVEITVIEI